MTRKDIGSWLLLVCLPLFVLFSFLPFRHIFNIEQIAPYGWTIEPLAISLYFADLVFVLILIGFVITSFNLANPTQIKLLAWVLTAYFVIELIHNPINSIAFYQLTRAIQFILLLLIFRLTFKNSHIYKACLIVLVFLGIFESLLSFYQFTQGHSFGLKYLGEQQLSTAIPGVAKVDLSNNTKILRGYGTMTHSNILGGLLALTIFSTTILLKQASTKLRNWYYFAILIQLIGLIVTFSRSAWLTIGLLGAVYVYQSKKQIQRITPIFVIIFGFLLILLLNTNIRLGITSRLVPPETDKFLSDRVILKNNAWQVIRNNPILGIGTGNYISSLLERVPRGTLKPWQYDYPHNISLVFLAELGAIGTILVIYFIYKLLAQDYRNSLIILTIIILSPILFLDHYLWTNQPGKVLLVLLLLVIPSLINKTTPVKELPEKHF